MGSFGGDSGAGLNDRDMTIFVTWFCSDRELACGETPAASYAARSDIDVRERDVAARIAAARLRLQRVRSVEAGRWIELEDVLSGAVTRVRSGDVSREATRWDILLCRVMEDDLISSLWGPVQFYRPDEEPDLLAECERLAGVHRMPIGSDCLFGAAALELMRFVPAGRCAASSRLRATRSSTAGRAGESQRPPPHWNCWTTSRSWRGLVRAKTGRGRRFSRTVPREQLRMSETPLPPVRCGRLAVGEVERIDDVAALPAVVWRRFAVGQRRRAGVGVLDPASAHGERCDAERHVSLRPGPRCRR